MKKAYPKKASMQKAMKASKPKGYQKDGAPIKRVASKFELKTYC